MNSSLKNLCKSFNVPESISKEEFDTLSITEINYIENKSKVIHYLENDILSLAFIWDQQIKSYISVMSSVNNSSSNVVDVRKCLSSASVSFNIYCYYYNDLLKKYLVGNFDSSLL